MQCDKHAKNQTVVINIGAEEKDNHWAFYVKDNGVGLDKKHFNRIFKIFQTLEEKDNFESTGIGLTIVKKIIEVYNGKVWVESEVGKGATFYFTIRKPQGSTQLT